MSQTPSSSSSGGGWNLGKSRPSSTRNPVPVEKKVKAPEKPAPAATAKALDAILADEEALRPPGRPIPDSKGIRGAINHPLFMAGSGLLGVIAILYLVFGGSLAFMFGGRSGNFIAPPTAEERAAAMVAGLASQQSPEEARARLLIAGGQILEASGIFLTSPMGSVEGGEDHFEYIPEHLTRVRMPDPASPGFIEFRLHWDQQAQASIEMGHHVIRTARANSIRGDAVRRLATRLRAEGLAILDDMLEGPARSGLSGIDGARARLVSGTNLMPREEADQMAATLLTDPLGQQILSARSASDAPPLLVEEGSPQP